MGIMNLRNWSKGHTYGLIIGIATTIICIPLVILILSKVDNQEFSSMWLKFKILNDEKSRIISLASIANLIWFHTFYRKHKDAFSMGIIMSTVVSLLVILYFKFLA